VKLFGSTTCGFCHGFLAISNELSKDVSSEQHICYLHMLFVDNTSLGYNIILYLIPLDQEGNMCSLEEEHWELLHFWTEWPGDIDESTYFFESLFGCSRS
jgi:hypothetical protein